MPTTAGCSALASPSSRMRTRPAQRASPSPRMLGGHRQGVLYDRAVAATQVVPAHRTWTRAWKPGVAGIREVFHARFADHAYPLHTHDVWTLFVVDDGAIRYDLHGRQRGAEPSMAYLLPPHVAHDGRAAVDSGFVNRVIYVETSA